MRSAWFAAVFVLALGLLLALLIMPGRDSAAPDAGRAEEDAAARDAALRAEFALAAPAAPEPSSAEDAGRAESAARQPLVPPAAAPELHGCAPLGRLPAAELVFAADGGPVLSFVEEILSCDAPALLRRVDVHRDGRAVETLHHGAWDSAPVVRRERRFAPEDLPVLAAALDEEGFFAAAPVAAADSVSASAAESSPSAALQDSDATELRRVQLSLRLDSGTHAASLREVGGRVLAPDCPACATVPRAVARVQAFLAANVAEAAGTR